MGQIRITNTIWLDEDELQERFVRASGPGGQNVNKVSSAVQLRFDVRGSPSLPDRVREKLLNSNDSRLTKDGELVLEAARYRTQDANRRDALERLKEIIKRATQVPRKRIATKPSLGSRKRRMDTKTKRGLLKKQRSGKIDTD